MLIVLEVFHAARVITRWLLDFHLRKSIILSTILQEIKKEQALKNLMYVFVYCPKLTNRPEITIKSCIFTVLYFYIPNSRLFANS